MVTSAPRIDDYAIVGDCRSAALVSRGGSIDWLCWPAFDSPSLFGALLDREKGGRFSICPTGDFRSERAYVHYTNVLRTRFVAAAGEAVLTDFMPVADELDRKRTIDPENALVRVVECVRGEVELEILFAPRPGYACERVRIVDAGKLGLRFETRLGLLTLSSSAPLTVRPDAASGRVRLRGGERLELVLTFACGVGTFIPFGDPIRETEFW
jgi:hypothetical protein